MGSSPRAGEHTYPPICVSPDSSSCAGSIHFSTRGGTRKQPENIQFPCCVEMSRRFLAYGGHAPTGFGS